MKIFDCHLHIEKGLKDYDLGSVTKSNVIFNEIETYEKFIDKVKPSDSVALVFDVKNFDFVVDQHKKKRINALKIISRDQKLTQRDYDFIQEKLPLFSDDVVVIIDAFYYGAELLFQPSLTEIIRTAVNFPNKKIVVAHCGGHKVLDYFLHLRQLPNIYYDLSLSLQYLYDSSTFLDLIKLINYTPKEKIMFGTDYYWASPKKQYQILNEIFDRLSVAASEREMILYQNAEDLLKNKQIR